MTACRQSATQLLIPLPYWPLPRHTNKSHIRDFLDKPECRKRMNCSGASKWSISDQLTDKQSYVLQQCFFCFVFCFTVISRVFVSCFDHNTPKSAQLSCAIKDHNAVFLLSCAHPRINISTQHTSVLCFSAGLRYWTFLCQPTENKTLSPLGVSEFSRVSVFRS